ncbi:hypothetical protein ONR75_18270 [Rhodopseudomonas sp. P2A-2r]|nr:hypothetical protein [Rhodopseudomonas sp. P2A-2r]UZE46954.1 hypothetical protein ONR75_18270 [Rhodopseudomonas sp. P2A-2r]
MPKKPITADELIYMFHEELVLLYDWGRTPSVAIVPDSQYG